MYLGAEFAARVNDQVGSTVEVSGASFSALSGQRSFDGLENTHVLFVANSSREAGSVFVSVSSRVAGAIAEAIFGGALTLEDTGSATTSVDAVILTLILNDVLVRLNNYGFPKAELNRVQAVARVAPISYSAKDVTGIEKLTLCNISIDLNNGDENAETAINFHFPMGYLESHGLLEKGRKRDANGDEDSHWRHELTENVVNSEIELDIILDTYEAKLSALTTLKIGEVIPLSSNADKISNIVLNTASGAQLIGTGRLGAYKTNKAIKLLSALDLMTAQSKS